MLKMQFNKIIMRKTFEEQINKADSLLRKNKPLEAVLILKKIVDKFPDNSYGYYLLGIARLKCGLFNLAKKSFEEADKLNINHPDNFRSLGWAKIMLNETDEGRNDLRYSINLDLTDYRAYLDLAISYFNHFDFDEGFAWLDRAKSLNPEDKFIAENYKFSEKAKKEFLAMPEEKRIEIKNMKSNPEFQKKIRLDILEIVFGGDGICVQAAEELKEELSLSGYSEDMFVYKDDIDTMKKETKESILKKRKQIEDDLLVLIKKLNIKLKLDDIKKIIYFEKDHKELDKIILEFDNGQDFEKIKNTLDLINNAWNYFPHKSLDGLSPAEKVLEHKNKTKNV